MMLGVKNLRVVAAGLCLGVTLLSGCGNDDVNVNPNEVIIGGSSKNIILNYESDIPTGTITYDNLNKFIKIATLEYNEEKYHFLLIKDQNSYSTGMRADLIKYIDLKTGTTLIEYYDYLSDKKENYWVVGENLSIIEEHDINGYLLQENFIKREYTVEEVITFFEEKIKPTLESSEKELIK